MANVIVVDDELIVLDVLTSLLGKLGHKVWRAGEPADALRLLRGPGTFDLVILDLVMPGMSGLELAKQIRAKYPVMAMIAMSGYLRGDSTETLETLHALGITEVLQKPIEPLDLETAVYNSIQYNR